jgi:Na+/melibiose symporter-like transporter
MKTEAAHAQPAQALPTIQGPMTTSPETKSRLSVLWIFYMFNAAYIDITTLYYSVFVNHKPTVHYSQVFLLGAAVLIEISIAMVLLSRVLNYRSNRRANIITGTFLTAVQLMTLFVGTPTLAYLFFSVILVATSAVIVRFAWKWLDPEVGPVATPCR